MPVFARIRLLPLIAVAAWGVLGYGQQVRSGPWVMESSGTTAGLRGVHAVGGGVAWASGTDGTVLRTEDGGYVWQRCAIPPGAEKLDFRGIWAWDADTAIIMSSGTGDLSRIYKTTDGCSHWTLLFTNPDKDGFWDAMVFQGRRHGYLVGDPVNGVFAIFESRDGGANWARWNVDDKKHPPKAQPGETLFAAGNQAAITPGNNAPFAFVTGGAGSRLYRAEAHSPFDAAFWSSLGARLLEFASGPTSGAFAIAARPSSDPTYSDLMIVGGDYRKPNAPSASAFVPGVPRPLIGHRKIQWSKQPPHGFRSAVAWDADAKAWIAAGTNGSDVSYDDGKTWTPLDNGNWIALSLPWVVGPHGRIAKLDESKLPKR